MWSKEFGQLISRILFSDPTFYYIPLNNVFYLYVCRNTLYEIYILAKRNSIEISPRTFSQFFYFVMISRNFSQCYFIFFICRNTLYEIYFGKTRDIVNGLRSIQPLADSKQQEDNRKALINALASKNVAKAE